jgi:adenosylhomocysteine nucleosidase
MDNPLAEKGSVGIVVAMRAELRHLLAAIEVQHETREGIWLDQHFTVNGMPIVAVQSGIGLINAAAATERLINAYHPAAILNFGCAGAHRRDIMPGDVVIGDRVVHHSALQILPSGEEQFKGSGEEIDGERLAWAELPADPGLVARAVEAAKKMTPEPWPRNLGWPPAIPYRLPTVHVGTVASSDIWTQSHARLDILHGRHNSLCEEEEAAAIAQICHLHVVPFLPIKDISNNEYHRATDITEGFAEFPIDEVGKRAADLTLRLLEKMATPQRGLP